MENRFLKFLEEIASTDWEYGDSTPMVGDARKHLDEFYRIAELEQQLADEKKAAGHWMEQSCKDHNRAEKLEQQLSRYQGAVEVDGVVEFYPGTKIAGVFVHQKMPDEMVGGQVRVLVMKEVE